MRDIYLGDSYDLVKRFWAESLLPLARLYAHPRFVPAAIRARYTAVTTIPVLDPSQPPEEPFGLLFDPHTGIPLPVESSVEASASHAPLPFIIKVNTALRPQYMICFDQSYHRRHELTTAEQLEQKRKFLQAWGGGRSTTTRTPHSCSWPRGQSRWPRSKTAWCRWEFRRSVLPCAPAAVPGAATDRRGTTDFSDV